MEVPLRTAYGQNGRCSMQPKPSSLRAQAQLKHELKLELVEEKQKLLDIRRKENARELGTDDSSQVVIFKDGNISKFQWPKSWTHDWRVMSSRLEPVKTQRAEGVMHIKYVEAQTFSCWCGVEVRRGVPAQVSSWSLDHDSKVMRSVAKSPRVAE
ncbi:hypothetical protein TNCV_1684331 [Trichonephila clavipes]|nr:hypothetical protein TNCV_1684331 [Trichonephila clavipes]